MDGDLYDEFGNYIGDGQSDSDDEGTFEPLAVEKPAEEDNMDIDGMTMQNSFYLDVN
jgi:hypothetical protein